jgi:dimethylhistidine N-methyltransferase
LHERPRVDSARVAQFAADVRYYLSLRPKQLPSRYLYDALGSELFEAICRLPWYRITRAELRLLNAHAASIVRAVEPLATIVELGSGSGAKLRVLLEAGRVSRRPVDVHLVDVSAEAIELSDRTLGALDDIRLVAHQATYETGLAEAAHQTRRRGRTLVLFLGSNIGNLDPPGTEAFLRTIRANLSTDDALLVGADLIKPERELLLAYDDPLGVTAAFNRNLLLQINSVLGGNFDLGEFAHRATWNRAASRIEMHLVARSPQHVRIPALQFDMSMDAGEGIWTESSYKYEPEQMTAVLKQAGFSPVAQWIDDEDRFALSLVRAT